MAARRLTNSGLRRLAADGFAGVDIVYQPQYCLIEGTLAGAEALVRFPTFLEPTSAVIAMAERTGLVAALDRAVIVAVLAAVASWIPAQGPRLPRVSLNLSARTTADPAFVDWLARACREAGVGAEMITLELTESAAPSPDLPTLAGKLADAGFRLSLDDFGTGFASILSAAQLPITEAKVARELLRESRRSPKGQSLFRHAVAMLRACNLDVVVEGIEDHADLDLVRAATAPLLGQGYLLARPFTSAQLLRNLGPLDQLVRL